MRGIKGAKAPFHYYYDMEEKEIKEIIAKLDLANKEYKKLQKIALDIVDKIRRYKDVNSKGISGLFDIDDMDEEDIIIDDNMVRFEWDEYHSRN